MKGNIVLVGFMGTGKSAVGQRLAERLNMRFVSTDELIEKQEGRPITEIFAKSGEPYFRKIEKEVVRRVSELDNVVIAAGGGVVLDEENMENLRKKGVIICLSATPEVIYQRTRDYNHRPLLNVPDPTKRIKELLDKRAPFYEKAEFSVDTSSLSIDDVVEEVLKITKKQA